MIYSNSKSTAELKQKNDNPFIVNAKRVPPGRRGRKFGQRVKRTTEPTILKNFKDLNLKDKIEDKIENQIHNRRKRQVSEIH